uniref:Ig-like domain-containing protein n=1 Tax=Poecilia mexicana TaxID=48701 RepID=A0A3B3WY22_9TELE
MKLLHVFVSVSSEVRGQVTVTQPGSVRSAVGESVTINCRTSQRVYSWNSQDYMAWYQQKDGKFPKLLMVDANRPADGIPSRFSGSGSSSDFTLTISGVRAEDAAVYLCHCVHIGNRPGPHTQSKLLIQKLPSKIN